MNNRHPLPLQNPSAEDIEASLRQCAPALRPELRERVLARCQDSARSASSAASARPQRLAERLWHFAQQPLKVLGRPMGWRVASVCALCVLQWIVVSHFDARSEAAIHGGPPAPIWAAARRDLSQAERDWPQALQRRALLLSALMNNGEAALPAAPPSAHPS